MPLTPPLVLVCVTFSSVLGRKPPAFLRHGFLLMHTACSMTVTLPIELWASPWIDTAHLGQQDYSLLVVLMNLNLHTWLSSPISGAVNITCRLNQHNRDLLSCRSPVRSQAQSGAQQTGYTSPGLWLRLWPSPSTLG